MKRLEMGRTMWRRLMALGFHDPGTPLIFVIISVDVMWLCPQTYNPTVRISNFNEKGRTLSPTGVLTRRPIIKIMCHVSQFIKKNHVHWDANDLSKLKFEDRKSVV